MEVKENQDLLPETNLTEKSIGLKCLLFLLPSGYDVITAFSILLVASNVKEGGVVKIPAFLIYILLYLSTRIGVAIGKVLLNIAKPDMYLSNGFWDAIKKNIFWNFGPQIIGVIVVNILVWYNLLEPVAK